MTSKHKPLLAFVDEYGQANLDPDKPDVCEMTLRRWDRSGKFSARRRPINNYRCYLRADVLKLWKQIESGKAA